MPDLSSPTSPASLDPVKTYCDVLIYQKLDEKWLILCTYVVPSPSDARDAIEKKWKEYYDIYIKKPPPIESLWMNSYFKLSTSCQSTIIPKVISLTNRTSPAYFEVCIKQPDDEFEMVLMAAEKDIKIWEAAIRKGPDYKETKPTRSADQGGAVATALTGEDPQVTANGDSPEAKYVKNVAQDGSHVSAPVLTRVQGNISINSNIHHHYHVMETRAEVKDVVDNTNEDKVGTHTNSFLTVEGAGPRSSSASPVKARDKVKKSRIEFIKRIGKALLKDLLDHLQDASVISGRENNHVLEENSVTEDQVTCLVDMVWKKGERACEIFLSLLSKHDKNLYKELGLLTPQW